MGDVHVVIGGGTIGARLAKLLAANGKRVQVIARSTAVHSTIGVEYRAGDATSFEALKTIAPDARVVFNCANPPYIHWRTEWPKLSSAVNEYAIHTGADLVICSNLYGYGPYDGLLTEEVPLNATRVNGQARAKVWQEAKALHDAGILRVTEVRGSDYICATDQSRMGHRVVPNLLLGKKVQLLGALDQPHTWTDPDDVATLMMTLATDERSWGRPWHVPSNQPKTQQQVVADITEALGVTKYRLSAVGGFMEWILGLFSPLIRELNRGSYQFNHPFIMSSDAAQETFGLAPKPWPQVINDVVQPYLEYVRREGRESLAKLSHQRIPESHGHSQ